MTPRVVIDASVVLKWFLSDGEGDSGKALELRERFLAGDLDIRAPELLILETANVLRYKSGAVREAVAEAVATLWQMEFTVPVDPDVARLAIELAFELGATVYDTTYLALAEMSGAALVTADKKFYRKASGRKVLLLSDM